VRRTLVAAVAIVAVATGCAGIPQSGPIRLGHGLPAAPGAGVANIPVLPPGPQVGASPTDLVSGFLTAAVDLTVARTYLATGTTWDSGSSITTYDDPADAVRIAPDTVRVTAHRVGVITSRGIFRIAPGTFHVDFGVVRRDGQWRIGRLPSGVLLSTDEAERSLQPAAVYYLNRTEDRVVPDQVLVPPQQPGLATLLIRDLIDGPNPHLAPAVTTAVPQGTTLVGSVPVSADGTAEVNLSAEARNITPSDLAKLSAQVVWTLRQLSSVNAVRLLADNAPLTSREVASVQSVRSWEDFDPAAPPTSKGALIARGTSVGAIGTLVPPALSHRRLLAPARSADGAVVAALRPDRQQLLVGGLNGSLRVRVSAGALSDPTLDPAGDVFVAASTPFGERILDVPRAGRPRAVALPDALRGEHIDALAISRDGSRIALVVGPPRHANLEIGTISSLPDHPVIHDVWPITTADQGVAGIAWLAANEVVTTTRTQPGHRSVVEVSIDGYQQQILPTAGAPPAPDQVAAAPGQRVLISASGGVWSLAGNAWVRRASGSDPSYAG
jgi:hypothetical protein